MILYIVVLSMSDGGRLSIQHQPVAVKKSLKPNQHSCLQLLGEEWQVGLRSKILPIISIKSILL